MSVSWERNRKRLVEYVAKNGRLPTESHKTKDITSLGKWLNNQRYNRAKLTAKQQASLESIAGWRWRILEKQKPVLADRTQEWQRKCDLVRAYVAANGRLPIRKHKANDGTKLGQWISNQRQKRAKLTTEQQASLESIEGWRWRVREIQKPALADRTQEWQRKCDLVRKYMATHGQLPTTKYKANDGTKLGQWIHDQRQNRAKLTEERRASLESIVGWRWPSSDEDTEWARECAQLRECSAAKRRKQDE